MIFLFIYTLFIFFSLLSVIIQFQFFDRMIQVFPQENAAGFFLNSKRVTVLDSINEEKINPKHENSSIDWIIVLIHFQFVFSFQF